MKREMEDRVDEAVERYKYNTALVVSRNGQSHILRTRLHDLLLCDAISATCWRNAEIPLGVTRVNEMTGLNRAMA
jgi:hypothetical protein